MSGSIKTYTPNFKMIIPEFNVATWHDYIEENFRNIDALFYNLFGINGFSGIWKTNTAYKANQVLFIGEDNGSKYEGKLVKVVQDTNTGGFTTFSEAIERYPSHYEIYADASSAEIFATLAKDWANKTGSTIKTPTGEDTGEYSAKHYQTLAKQNEEQCELYKNFTDTNVQLTVDYVNAATTQANIATTHAQNAKTSENNALSYKNSAQSSATSAQNYLQQAQTIVTDFDEHAQNLQNDFDSNAVSKTTSYNDNASSKVNEYNKNNDNKTNAFNDNYTTKLNSFNANATEKTNQVNTIATNVSTLVTGFDDHVETKTNEFNTNADTKTTTFNTNAKEKQTLVDISASNAQTSATNAKISENNAKNYSELAESSATTATQMADSATISATTATTQAGIAATKAQNASESAVTATSKANIATTKAQEASTSATNASSSATSASNSASLAKSWATDDITSRPEGSAKYWAEQASAGQLQADWNQTNVDQKDFIKNKPTKLSQFTNDTNFVNTTQLATKQDTSNLSQTIDDSTTKYPSNKSVKDAIDQLSTNVVHKNGDETISGTKTFTQTIDSESSGLDVSIIPTDTQYHFPINIYDKNHILYGSLIGEKRVDGSVRNSIQSIYTTNGTTYYSALSTVITNDGIPYATCVTPPTNSTGTEIVTANWVRNYVALDYKTVIEISGAGIKTAPYDGVLIITPTTTGGENYSECRISIEGNQYVCAQGYVGLDYAHVSQAFFPFKSGETYTIDLIDGCTLRYVKRGI